MNRNIILARIGKLAKAVAATVAEIQALAVIVLLHAVRHGDVTLADELMSACGKGMRRSALEAWFVNNGPFVVVEGKFGLNKELAKKMRAQSDEAITESLASLKWEEAKKAKAVVTKLDCAAEIDRALAKLSKAVEGADESVNVVHGELLALIVQTAAQWNARRILASVPLMDEAEQRATLGYRTAAPAAPVQQTAPELLHLLQGHFRP